MREFVCNSLRDTIHFPNTTEEERLSKVQYTYKIILPDENKRIRLIFKYVMFSTNFETSRISQLDCSYSDKYNRSFFTSKDCRNNLFYPEIKYNVLDKKYLTPFIILLLMAL